VHSRVHDADWRNSETFAQMNDLGSAFPDCITKSTEGEFPCTYRESTAGEQYRISTHVGQSLMQTDHPDISLSGVSPLSHSGASSPTPLPSCFSVVPRTESRASAATRETRRLAKQRARDQEKALRKADWFPTRDLRFKYSLGRRSTTILRRDQEDFLAMANAVKQLWKWSSGDFEREIEMEGALEAYGSSVAIEFLPKIYLNT